MEIKKNMKQVEKSWFSWQLAGLMVVVVVFISMAEPVTSQSNNRNSTLIRDFCSSYRGMSEKYFLSNLNTTLSNLRHQLSVNGIRYAVAHTLVNGEAVWALASCRGYVSKANCVACFDYAVADQPKKCGFVNGAHAFYNDCDVRYENFNFFDDANLLAGIVICGNKTSPWPTDFQKTAEGLLSDLRTAVPRTSNFYAASTRRIAKGNDTIYAIAQCNLNISQTVCEGCLNARYGSIDACLPRTTGRAVDNGCFMRYSRTPFFGQNQTTNITSLLWDDETPFYKDVTNFLKGHAGALGGGVGLFFLLLVFWLFYCLRKKSRKTQEDTPEIKGAVSYDYKHLQSATNNFSEENIIGKGGFGEVFKAILDDKKVVAVKKLKVRYARAKVEFENEVLLTSHIHHRNLLRLLGFSSDVSNLLLVLEYMPNGSLDKFLWGTKKGTLNWTQRYNIIFGIARGLAHLHKEFHAKIIHRDIKSSNILLDEDFQPKIADFGLARFQPDNQTHVVTKFGGTLGYTAPEYVLHGHLSEKVDTFSFGIVILEIISGRKCTDISFVRPSTDYLLEHAWTLYENKEHMKLIDETMEVNQYEEEHVMKIIEIALLCTQSPVSRRPAMSEVVSILPNGQALGIREIIRPIFIDLNRRIHIDASKNSMDIGNVQLHSEKADDEGDAMEKGMNGANNQ